MSVRGCGKGLNWLLDHKDYEGDDCLIWPFFRFAHTGYGVVGINGHTQYANRVMCEFANGPAPSPKHESAHSCNNGHEGCTNPRHLSWKTHSQNQLDRHTNGKSWRGTGPRYKLSPNQVAEIVSLRGKETQAALAARFGVSRENICIIQSGKSWKNLQLL